MLSDQQTLVKVSCKFGEYLLFLFRLSINSLLIREFRFRIIFLSTSKTKVSMTGKIFFSRSLPFSPGRGNVVIILFLSAFLFSFSSHKLRSQNTSADSLREVMRQVEILTQEFEKLKLGEVAVPSYESSRGLGPAASKVYQLKKSGVSIAGYGEILYQNFSKTRDDGNDANKKNTIDFLRNVVYVGFRFNDWILFNSEIEFEHATTGEGAEEKGEVSVEFGYIELMFSKHFNLRTGMMLSPLGIVNEKHEPSTFFGTLRPQVEQRIIPSTWRTIGIGAYGEIIPDLNYRGYVVEGLNAAGFTDTQGIREGRQSGSEAIAQDLGFTGKIEFEGISGATIGTSFYKGNSGQGATDSLGEISAATSLFSLHGEYAWKGFELRALYSQVTIDQAARVSMLTGKTIGSKMTGWYVTVGYDVVSLLVPGTVQSLSPYVQYERFNTQASVKDGMKANGANDRSIMTVGIAYKPHPNVAFKIEHRNNKNEALAGSTAVNQVNVALNYLF